MTKGIQLGPHLHPQQGAGRIATRVEWMTSTRRQICRGCHDDIPAGKWHVAFYATSTKRHWVKHLTIDERYCSPCAEHLSWTVLDRGEDIPDLAPDWWSRDIGKSHITGTAGQAKWAATCPETGQQISYLDWGDEVGLVLEENGRYTTKRFLMTRNGRDIYNKRLHDFLQAGVKTYGPQTGDLRRMMRLMRRDGARHWLNGYRHIEQVNAGHILQSLYASRLQSWQRLGYEFHNLIIHKGPLANAFGVKLVVKPKGGFDRDHAAFQQHFHELEHALGIRPDSPPFSVSLQWMSDEEPRVCRLRGENAYQNNDPMVEHYLDVMQADLPDILSDLSQLVLELCDEQR